MFPFLSFIILILSMFYFFFFNDTATTEIYTLSLHDALPIYQAARAGAGDRGNGVGEVHRAGGDDQPHQHEPAGQHHHDRSEEHTSELQSRLHLVCRLLLEKKKKTHITTRYKRRIGQCRPIME